MLERRGISFILIALSVVTLLWTGWMEFQGLRMYRENAGRELLARAEILGQAMQRAMGTADTVMHSVGVARTQFDVVDKRSEEQLQAQLEHLQKAVPLLRALVVFDESGTLVLDSEIYPPKVVNVADRDYFRYFSEQEGNQTAGVFVGEPVQGRTSGQWFLGLARAFRVPGKAFGGVVLGVTNVSEFSEILRTATWEVSYPSDVVVYSAKGTVVGTTLGKDPLEWMGQSTENLPPYAGTDIVSASRGLIDGEESLIAVVPVAGYPLKVAVSRSWQSVYEAWGKVFLRDMAAMTVLILALALASVLTVRVTNDRERLFRQSPNPICILDGDGRFIRINESCVSTLGWTEAEIRQRLLPDLVAAPENSRLRQILRTLSHYDHGEEVVCRFNTKSGQDLWLELSLFSARGRVFCISRNLTERVAAEMALADSEERYRGIVETVVDGLMTFDGEGRIQSVNPAAEKLFGYEAKDMIGCDIFALMPLDINGEHPIESALRGEGTSRNNREIVGRRSDGSEFPIELGLSSVQLRHGQLLLCICRDISERKRMERLKDEFVSTVSHELRTPLTSIRGSLGLIIGGAAGTIPEKAQRLVSIAHANCERLVNLVNDILDIQRIESGRIVFDMRPLELVTLLERSVEENTAYAAGHGAVIRLNTPAKVMVRGDSERLLQVMANLLSNAAKFSPDKGEITISVSHTGARVRISVADQGPGIPPEFQSRIFQKFSQADSTDTRSKGGTGLGLSIVRAIVEHHGGSVSYQTAKDKGTVFHVDLPAYDKGSSETEVEHNHRARVLVVEDDPDVARVLQMMLEGEGFAADVAPDAGAALLRLEEQDYVAMTLDLLLPDTDGMNLVQSVRAKYSPEELPIVVVSAVAQERRPEGGAIGIVDWIRKPINESRLMTAMRQAVPLVGGGSKVRALHVEDDDDLCLLVRTVLEPLVDVVTAGGLKEARKLLDDPEQKFDLVLLDLALPDGRGEELFPLIRSRPAPLPVIILSGHVPVVNDPSVAASLMKSRVSNEQLAGIVSRVLREHISSRNKEEV